MSTPAASHTTAGVASACARPGLSRLAFRATRFTRRITCSTITIAAFAVTLAIAIATRAVARSVSTGGPCAHGGLRPNPFLFAQQQLIEIAEPTQKFRIEHGELFGQRLFRGLIDSRGHRHHRRDFGATQFHRQRNPGLHQFSTIFGNQSVQTRHVGRVVRCLHSAECPAPLPVVEVLFGGHHGGMVDTQAVEQACRVGGQGTTRQAQHQYCEKHAGFHQLSRILKIPDDILIRAASAEKTRRF